MSARQPGLEEVVTRLCLTLCSMMPAWSTWLLLSLPYARDRKIGMTVPYY
jgi:hypothetical protein